MTGFAGYLTNRKQYTETYSKSSSYASITYMAIYVEYHSDPCWVPSYVSYQIKSNQIKSNQIKSNQIALYFTV